jgi:transposase
MGRRATPYRTTDPGPFPSRPRLHLVRFPGYAPELNPDKGIWKLAKQALANGCPRDVFDLIPSLVGALESIRKNPKHLRGWIDDSALPSFCGECCIRYA